MRNREVRIRTVSALGPELAKLRRIVLVDSDAWVMVRNADFPSAAPFVITRKEWEQLPRE